MKHNFDHVGMRQKKNGQLCHGKLHSNCTFNKNPSTKPCDLYLRERYCQIVHDCDRIIAVWVDILECKSHHIDIDTLRQCNLINFAHNEYLTKPKKHILVPINADTTNNCNTRAGRIHITKSLLRSSLRQLLSCVSWKKGRDQIVKNYQEHYTSSLERLHPGQHISETVIHQEADHVLFGQWYFNNVILICIGWWLHLHLPSLYQYVKDEF